MGRGAAGLARGAAHLDPIAERDGDRSIRGLVVLALIDPAVRPVIAHRGNSAHAPENTFASYDQAIALGVDALEFDVRLSRDGVPVVMHDPTLDRTTNGRGPVADRTVSELRGVDAGARFSPDGGRTFPYRGSGQVIPTLTEMISRYPLVPFLIEVKVPEAVGPTRAVLEATGAAARTLVDSTVHDAVAPFRGRGLATGASLDDVVRLLVRSLVARLPKSLPYEALCIPRWYNGIRVPVSMLARAARRLGAVTHVWTINDAAVARTLWTTGVHGIITDDPGPMLALRREMARERASSTLPNANEAPARG